MDERIGRCGHPLTGRQRTWCSEECQRAATRAAWLDQVFTMTPAQYDAILVEQGGVCPICLKRPSGKKFPVDHDHKTGLVRGVPCGFCNLHFLRRHSDPAKFRRAAEYLESPPAQRVIGQVVAPGRPKKARRSRTTPRTRRTKT